MKMMYNYRCDHVNFLIVSLWYLLSLTAAVVTTSTNVVEAAQKDVNVEINLLKDTYTSKNPSPENGYSSGLHPGGTFAYYNNHLYFTVFANFEGPDSPYNILWQNDGTTEGTYPVEDGKYMNISDLVAFDNVGLIFQGDYQSSSSSLGLMLLDESGTITELFPEPVPRGFFALEGNLVFRTTDPYQAIFMSNQKDGTRPISVGPGNQILNETFLIDHIFLMNKTRSLVVSLIDLNSTQNYDYQLWSTRDMGDTWESLMNFTGFISLANNEDISEEAPSEGFRLLNNGNFDTNTRELWFTDGTAEGSGHYMDFNYTDSVIFIDGLRHGEDILYAIGDRRSLYSVKHTKEPPQLIFEFEEGDYLNVPIMSSDILLFKGRNSTSCQAITTDGKFLFDYSWMVDGEDGDFSCYIDMYRPLVLHDGVHTLIQMYSRNKQGIWITDLTEEGSFLVYNKTVETIPDGPYPILMGNTNQFALALEAIDPITGESLGKEPHIGTYSICTDESPCEEGDSSSSALTTSTPTTSSSRGFQRVPYNTYYPSVAASVIVFFTLLF